MLVKAKFIGEFGTVMGRFDFKSNATMAIKRLAFVNFAESAVAKAAPDFVDAEKRLADEIRVGGWTFHPTICDVTTLEDLDSIDKNVIRRDRDFDFSRVKSETKGVQGESCKERRWAVCDDNVLQQQKKRV
jgi:hypothetical protein